MIIQIQIIGQYLSDRILYFLLHFSVLAF
jgi:hypothetical protein